MKTSELFRKKKVLSLEIFPPKRDAPVATVYRAIDGLKDLNPDFISVTYGAGGGPSGRATVDIATAIKRDYGIESVAHLPGIHLTRSEAASLLEDLAARGIENILARRGDTTPDNPGIGDFPHASDLIAFIKARGDFNILGACYPEGHPESGGVLADIRNLKAKVEAGADHLISQLFFDNRHFYRFRERAALAGIDAPIEAGIMPVVNKRQIERMVSLCGAELPEKFVKMMARFEHDPIATRDAGIAYAVNQIVDLVAQDVDGIHLYTMNNPYVARRIYEAVASLLSA